MNKFITRSRILRFRAVGGVSVAVFALLVGGMLMPISPASADIVDATITIDGSPVGVAINPAGTFAYVTDNTHNTVLRINLANNKVNATITVGTNPNSVAINPAGTFAYVANSDSNNVSRINLATNKVDATITVGTSPSSVAINPAGTFALVANYYSGTVSKLNLSDNTIVATIKVGTNPNSVAINSAGTFAYVANGNSDSVSKINLATNTTEATISVGSKPNRVAINPAGTFAFVANSNSNTVSRIDLATDTTDATISVGKTPWSVAIDPSGKFAYVTNFESKTLSRINLAAVTPNVIPTPVSTTVPGVDPVQVVALAPFVTEKKTVSATTLANYAGLAVPIGATISVLVAPSSAMYCKTSGATVNAVKAGSCEVVVTVKPQIGSSESKTVALIMTNEFLRSPANADRVDVTIKVGGGVQSLAIDPAGRFALVTIGGTIGANGTVSRINLATNKVDATIKVGLSPTDVAIDPAGTFAYVLSTYNPPLGGSGKSIISKINLATNEVVATFKVGRDMEWVRANSAGTFAYIYTRWSTTAWFEINLVTNKVVDFGDYPLDPLENPLIPMIGSVSAINTARTFLYVLPNIFSDDPYKIPDDTISKINIATDKVVATIKVGKFPVFVTINPAGTFAYVVNANFGPGNRYGTVSRINLATDKVVATIKVGNWPWSMTINPAGTFAYITNYASDTVSRINLAATIP